MLNFVKIRITLTQCQVIAISMSIKYISITAVPIIVSACQFISPAVTRWHTLVGIWTFVTFDTFVCTEIQCLFLAGLSPETYSVPNSSYGLIFVKIWAKYGHFFGKNTGKTHFFVILSSFCDLVHIQKVVNWFVK